MKKTEVKINISDFPEEIHYILENAAVFDSSSSPDMTVLYSNQGYYIKIAEKGRLSKESDMVRLFQNNGLGVDLVSYICDEKDYMITKAAKGEDTTHYIDNPEKLCEVLADTMKLLHSRPISDIPISLCMDSYKKELKAGILKQDTFIHGDFCLPNIILDNWRLSSIIDVGLAGAGDRHIDIFWALWSLNFNLKTDKYTDYFLDLYGKENYDKAVLRIVTEIEAQA